MANSNQAVIAAEGLTRRFGEVVAVDNLTLEVRQGEIFGFLGHNGAGKTTTVRLLNGVLTPSAGSARVLGLSPEQEGDKLREKTGVLTETPSLDERLTGRENLRIYADLFGVPPGEVKKRVEDLLELFQLAERGNEKVGGYSKGMKQRLALARAFLHRPQVLFLDEPTAGLDPVASRQVRDLITHISSEEGRTVFVCTHNLPEAQRLCDRVGVMEHGKLVAAGTFDELAAQIGLKARFEVEVAMPQVSQVLNMLLQMENVAEFSSEGSVITITGADKETIPDLLAAFVSAGIRVYRVAPLDASLEDIYFALHGEYQQSALVAEKEAVL